MSVCRHLRDLRFTGGFRIFWKLLRNFGGLSDEEPERKVAQNFRLFKTFFSLLSQKFGITSIFHRAHKKKQSFGYRRKTVAASGVPKLREVFRIWDKAVSHSYFQLWGIWPKRNPKFSFVKRKRFFCMASKVEDFVKKSPKAPERT